MPLWFSMLLMPSITMLFCQWRDPFTETLGTPRFCTTCSPPVWGIAGTAPALNDLIASHVDMIFMELASAIKLHQAGKARILAVATKKRIPELPDIPTMDEVGVKEFESGTWNAIVAPPKTPSAIVDKLNKAIVETLNSPEAQDLFGKLTLHAAGGTPAEARAFIAKETEVWSEVIRDAHVEAH